MEKIILLKLFEKEDCNYTMEAIISDKMFERHIVLLDNLIKGE